MPLVNMKDMLPNILGQRTKKRKMKVSEALEYLVTEEEQRLVHMDQVTRIAVERVESSGVIFLDEIDKIAGRESGHGGPDVSREGVQRDILPMVYSRYYLGSIAFLLGQHDRSAAQFRDGIATGKAAGVMEYLLRDGVARALEAKGDFAGAASAYREAAGFAGADMKPQSLLGEARCLALAGRKPEAVALYRQILSDSPESKVRTLIEIQLAQME